MLTLNSSSSLLMKKALNASSIIIKRDFRRKMLDNASTLITKKQEELIKKRMFKLMKRIQSTGNKALYDDYLAEREKFRGINNTDRSILHFLDHQINEFHPVAGDIEKLFIDYLKGTKTSLRDFDFEMSTIRYLMKSKDVSVTLKFLDYFHMDITLFNYAMDFLTLHGSFSPAYSQLLDFALNNPNEIFPGSIETLNSAICRHSEEMTTSEIIGSFMLYYRAGYYPNQEAINRTIVALSRSKDPILGMKFMNLLVNNELLEVHKIDPFSYNMLVENFANSFATLFNDFLDQYEADKTDYNEGDLNSIVDDEDRELLERNNVKLSTKYTKKLKNFNIDAEFIPIILRIRKAIEYFNDDATVNNLLIELKNSYLVEKNKPKSNNIPLIDQSYLHSSNFHNKNSFTFSKKNKNYSDYLNDLNNELQSYRSIHLRFKEHLPPPFANFDRKYLNDFIDVTPEEKIVFESLKQFSVQDYDTKLTNYSDFVAERLKIEKKNEKDSSVFYSTKENKIFMESIFRSLEDLKSNNNIIPILYKYCENIFDQQPNLNVINSYFNYYALKTRDPKVIFNIYDELCQLRLDNYEASQGKGENKYNLNLYNNSNDDEFDLQQEYRKENIGEYYLDDDEEDEEFIKLEEGNYDEETLEEIRQEREAQKERIRLRNLRRLEKQKQMEELRLKEEEERKQEEIKLASLEEQKQKLIEIYKKKKNEGEKEAIIESEENLIKFEKYRAKQREKERKKYSQFKLTNINKNNLLYKFNGRTYDIILTETMKHFQYDKLLPIIFDIYLNENQAIVSDNLLFRLETSMKNHIVSFESRITYYNPIVQRTYHTLKYISKLIRFNSRNVIYKTMELDLAYHRVLKKINAPLLSIHEHTREIVESEVDEQTRYEEEEKIRMRLENYNKKYEAMKEEYKKEHILKEKKEKEEREKIRKMKERNRRGDQLFTEKFIGETNEVPISNDDLVSSVFSKNKNNSYNNF